MTAREWLDSRPAALVAVVLWLAFGASALWFAWTWWLWLAVVAVLLLVPAVVFSVRLHRVDRATWDRIGARR